MCLEDSDKGIIVLDTISEGRFFRIYKARKGTKFIILKATVNSDAMSVEILRREYELGKSLSHSCIVSTQDFNENTPVGPAIILEYIDGSTLSEYIDTNPSISSKSLVLNDILDGVDYLHHRGILHNDLKPANIIINKNGAARIIDFGLSVSDDSVYKGCIGGSEGFSAPEIMQGKGPAGASSDIYSLGLLIKHLFGRKYRKISERCCHKDPSQRYQSIASLKNAMTFRKYLPIAAIVLIFAVFVLTLTLQPKVESFIAESSHNALKDRLRTEMASFYIPARDSMSCQQTFIEAGMFKNEYLQHYVHFRDSLPADQRLACEEIFAEQSAVLDSLLLSLQ